MTDNSMPSMLNNIPADFFNLTESDFSITSRIVNLLMRQRLILIVKMVCVHVLKQWMGNYVSIY